MFVLGSGGPWAHNNFTNALIKRGVNYNHRRELKTRGADQCPRISLVTRISHSDIEKSNTGVGQHSCTKNKQS